MTLRSPVLAILWENWRLTRVEAAWRLALGIVAPSAVLVVFGAVAPNEAVKDFGAVIALILLVVPHYLGWLSINKLSVGRPGFPLYLLYTHPVRTAVVVGVPMAYQAAALAALYLVAALLLRISSGYAFPLLPVAAWIAALYLAQAAVNWSIRRNIVRLLGHLAVSVAWFGLAMHRLTVEEIPGPDLAPPQRWPAVFDFPLTDYALVGAIGLASFGLTVAAVARQRRGDSSGAMPKKTGFTDISPFRFPCPTSSATRAQVWFELQSSGLPLITIGVALAIVNALLFAVSGPIDAALWDGFRPYVACRRTDGCFYARPFAMFFAMLSMLAVPAFGANAFGIRARQARWYASAFEATQPYGTGPLALVKVLVRSACVLAALTAIGVSAWASGTFVSAGEVFGEPLRSVQRAIEGAVGALTGDGQFALVVVASIGVALTVASLATLAALWARYPRRLNIAGLLFLVYGLALVLLALGQRWSALEIPFGAIFRATSWVATAAIVFATAYLAWRVVAERLLPLRQAGVAVLVSAAFAAAWLTLLRMAGVSLAGMPATDAAWMLSLASLPITMSVLAPWSLSRIRHL